MKYTVRITLTTDVEAASSAEAMVAAVRDCIYSRQDNPVTNLQCYVEESLEERAKKFRLEQEAEERAVAEAPYADQVTVAPDHPFIPGLKPDFNPPSEQGKEVIDAAIKSAMEEKYPF